MIVFRPHSDTGKGDVSGEFWNYRTKNGKYGRDQYHEEYLYELSFCDKLYVGNSTGVDWVSEVVERALWTNSNSQSSPSCSHRVVPLKNHQ